MKYLLCGLLGFGMLISIARSTDLSDADLARIGRKVWVNECAGTVSGLTSWNEGEEFASLGIGHFIWYPAGKRGPFEESFPVLVQYLAFSGYWQAEPGWLRGPCPWNTRAEFMAAQQSERMEALRKWLAGSVPLQARFLARRTQEALPKMLAAAADGGKVRRNFERLAATGPGTFALIDYVNFKGEGTLETERYKGEGWGLLQVLEAMPEGGEATRGFSEAAKAMLARRVRNSPPERHEERWLAGWDARVERYAE